MAAGYRVRAARVKAASGRNVDWVRDFPLENFTLAALARIGNWYNRQQGAGVGMLGIGQHIGGITQFYDAPQVHNGDTICEKPCSCQIMRDIQDADAVLVTQLS